MPWWKMELARSLGDELLLFLNGFIAGAALTYHVFVVWGLRF